MQKHSNTYHLIAHHRRRVSDATLLRRSESKTYPSNIQTDSTFNCDLQEYVAKGLSSMQMSIDVLFKPQQLQAKLARKAYSLMNCLDTSRHMAGTPLVVNTNLGIGKSQ